MRVAAGCELRRIRQSDEAAAKQAHHIVIKAHHVDRRPKFTSIEFNLSCVYVEQLLSGACQMDCGVVRVAAQMQFYRPLEELDCD